MKNRDLYRFKKGLEIGQKFPAKGFIKPVIKNLRTVLNETDVLDATIKPTEGYEEFEKERNVLIQKFAKKNDKGEVIQETKEVNGQTLAFFNIENTEEYNKEAEILSEKYKEEIETREAQLKAYEEELEEDVEIKIIIVKDDDVPDNIDGECYDILLDYMIEE